MNATPSSWVAMLLASGTFVACSTDEDKPCLDIAVGDEVEIALIAGGNTCSELGLGADAILLGAVKAFRPARSNPDGWPGGDNSCLFAETDFEPSAGFVWTRTGEIGGYSGRVLGGVYRLTRDDGCSGMLDAGLSATELATTGSLVANFTAPQNRPPSCPQSCTVDTGAIARKR